MGSTATFYIAWVSILLLNNVSAVSFPDSFFTEATKGRLNLLRSRHLQSSSSNPPLSLDQFDLCLADLNFADSNADSRLNNAEYIMFLSMNSAHYGYAWGDDSNLFSLSELPLEFAMLFHSTACMCAYEQDSASVDFGCCQGASEHVVIYADSVSNMTEEQEAYSRLFCSDAYYSYSSTFSPTKSPVVTTMPPNTLPPTVSITTLTTVAPYTSPRTPTASPVMPIVGTLPPSTPPPIVGTLPPSSPPSIVGTLLPSTPPPIVGTPLPTSTPPPIVGTSFPPSTPPPIVVTLPPSTPPPIVGTPLPPSTPPPIIGTSFSPSTPPPIVGTLPPSTMPPTASSTILEIGIEYGISSDCGVTAYDVMNGNYGITIKEGLITATEVVLVDILNSTYPRQEAQNSTEGAVETPFPQGIPTMPPVTIANSGSIPTMPPATSSFSIPTLPTSARGVDSSAPAGETTTKSLKTMNKVRIRVEGLPSAPLKAGLVGGDDPYNHRRDLAVLSVPEGKAKSLRGYRQQLDKQQHLQKGYRSLVYYTEQNPVIITDIEDVDEACPQGIVCMKVTSTVYVTLEEGDVADEVEAAFRSGFQKSLEDASFFNSMPADTIVCPPLSSAIPTTPSPTSYEPPSSFVLTTQSPSLTPVAISTAPSPTSIAINTAEPTSPPVAIPITPVPIATTPTTMPPFPTALTESPSSGSEEGLTGPINVTIQYTFNNDCGLDAEAIMNEEGNTFKDVFVDVTTAATVQILNETFPRVEEAGPVRKRGLIVRKRGLVHLDNPTSTPLFSSQLKRNLAYYTDQYPVTIDRIIDVESCDPGFSCLLVISTITVVLEAGDDPTQVSDAIVNGIADSFSDGSIYSTVPPEALECPAV